MTPEMVLAIGAMITAIMGGIGVLITNHSSATKVEVASLRDTIQALQDENVHLHERIKELEEENKALRTELDSLVSKRRRPKAKE